jgi:hypothetical protein
MRQRCLAQPFSLKRLQPLGAGLFKFDAGYQQAGEYIVSTDQGDGMVEEDDPKQITKWIGQTLAMMS